MARVEEIANFVGRRYRLPSGDQLVAVKGGPLALEDVTISAIAVRSAGQGGGEDIAVQRVENGVVYTMCGLGKRCSIAQGKPSEERGRLVRREALELALYTFAYMKDVDTVVAFLPPPAGAETTLLLYFRRSDFEELLARPLRETLPETEAPLATAIDSAEARVVDALTLPRVFGFALQQLQDGTLLLVLSPPTPTGDD